MMFALPAVGGPCFRMLIRAEEVYHRAYVFNHAAPGPGAYAEVPTLGRGRSGTV